MSELEEKIAQIIAESHLRFEGITLRWHDLTDSEKEWWRDSAKRIIPIIKEEGIKEGLDAALTAYESTCQALIEEARDSIRQAVEVIENPYPDKTRGFFGSAWRSASDYYGNKHGFNKAIQAVLKVLE